MLHLKTIARAATLAGLAALAVSAQAATVNVKIIGFNDFHGTLESPGTFGQNTAVPAASRPAVGGADYIAAYVANMRAANPNTVVVGAGDASN